MELTQEILKEKFYYHDGALYWKKIDKRMKGRYRLGTFSPKIGRNVARINNCFTSCARMIFLFHYGYLPKMVDHKDRNGLNDRIENLRPTDEFGNARNRTSNKGSTSKYLGVFLRRGKWKAAITVDKKRKTLGIFDVEEDAAIAFNEAAKIHYGEFANLNIIENKTPTF